MIDPNSKLYRKIWKVANERKEVICPLCNGRIIPQEFVQAVYVKTKRGKESFYHEKCIRESAL